MKTLPVPAILMMASISLSLPACHKSQAEHHEEAHKIVVTSPVEKDVISTESYVCQIHSCRHIDIRALEGGYLEEIMVKEGQAVKQGDPMFKILPILYQTKLAAAEAEAQRAQIELRLAKQLVKKGAVGQPEVPLAEAKLAKAQAEVKRARAELHFTTIEAPFDGIIDRLHERKGSLIEEGDLLTTLSDNSEMWVYFNVPEARYLEFLAHRDDEEYIESIELELANGNKFPYVGKLATIEADFNNETGTVAFRADFPNPHRLLRHGQTGNVLIHHELDDVIVIPQRATFEILDHRYVYVVGEDGVVHQRLITVQKELEDIFVIKESLDDEDELDDEEGLEEDEEEIDGDEEGLDEDDKIVLMGIRHVRDGEKTKYEFREPKQVLNNLKYEAQ